MLRNSAVSYCSINTIIVLAVTVYYKCQDYSDTIAKKCCRDTVRNVMSKFAVNAVQQIDSAIMSSLQRMPSNSSVFSWRRNAKYVDDVLTDIGNAFQARAAATRKAWSPRVARRVDGTSGVDVDPDLRCGILFMTWRVQGVMNGWLLVFLFEMCCHKAS